MKVNGIVTQVCETGKAFRFGLMDLGMMASGKMASQKAMVGSFKTLPI